MEKKSKEKEGKQQKPKIKFTVQNTCIPMNYKICPFAIRIALHRSSLCVSGDTGNVWTATDALPPRPGG